MGDEFDRWKQGKEIGRRRREEEGVRHMGPRCQCQAGKGRRHVLTRAGLGPRERGRREGATAWAGSAVGGGHGRAHRLLGCDLDGPRRSARAELGQKPNRIGFPSLFIFQIFQSHFPKDFESSFEFESNHSIQKFKCSSMNAQSCFYPYI
jgi:hypothetical protein